jgi:hypothetical protein
MLLVGIIWTFILGALVFVGLFLGLILGFALLFLLMGVVNSAITSFIWDINIELDLKGKLFHGIVLFIALIIAGIPRELISLFMPGLNTAILLFVLYCFVDGFVAKKVATIWAVQREVPEEGEVPEEEGLAPLQL